MKTETALKKYGYVILMLYRHEFGYWHYEFECFRTAEAAQKALHTERSCFSIREFVSMSEAKKHGFQPEPAYFADREFLTKEELNTIYGRTVM